MESTPYQFETPDRRTITATRVVQRDGNGRVSRTFLTDGTIDGEPLDDVELERLARRHAGFQ